MNTISTTPAAHSGGLEIAATLLSQFIRWQNLNALPRLALSSRAINWSWDHGSRKAPLMFVEDDRRECKETRL